MNTNQVMSMAGGVRVSRKMSAQMDAKSAPRGKDGSFNDVLAKSKGDSLTLQDVKDLAKDAQTAEKEAKLAEAVESVSTEAKTPTEDKSNGNADAKTKTTDIDGEIQDAPVEDSNAALFVAETGAAILATNAENLNTENVAAEAESNIANVDIKPELDQFAAKDVQNQNLQTILPQPQELGGKNKEMLAMLSGQHIPKQEESVDLKNFDLSAKDLNKTLTETPQVKSDAPIFTRQQPTDPLSALTSDMAKYANATETKGDVLPNKLGENLGDIKTFADTRNLANVKIVDDAKNIVNNLEIKPENLDVKQQVKAETAQEIILPDAKNIEVKAQPIAANLQTAKPAMENAQTNPLAGITVEVEDAEVLPVREPFAGFGQNTDNNDENQSMFRGDSRSEFIQNENATKAASQSVEGNQHFAHTLETQNTQQTANTREAAPTTALPRDDYNVREQIVQQARMIRAENGTEMVIRLKPEHLGDMTLRISVSSEGSVTASFFTNNAEVRHIVENSLVQLRQELQNQGIKVDKAEVYAGLSDGNLPQGQGQEAWQQNRGGNFSRGQFTDTETGIAQFEDNAAEAVAGNAPNTLADTGVDYLV